MIIKDEINASVDSLRSDSKAKVQKEKAPIRKIELSVEGLR